MFFGIKQISLKKELLANFTYKVMKFRLDTKNI